MSSQNKADSISQKTNQGTKFYDIELPSISRENGGLSSSDPHIEIDLESLGSVRLFISVIGELDGSQFANLAFDAPRNIKIIREEIKRK